MANVSFYRQTTGSTATGAITFDTTNKYIYLGDGSTAHKFNCNNTTYTFTANNPTLAWGTTSTVGTVGGTTLKVTMPANPNSDTKNTAGSSNTSSKIYLIGATSQATNPQTYSHDTAYVGTDGYLYSGGKLVAPILSRTVYGTATLTSASSTSDTVSLLSSTYGVILYVEGQRVGNLSDQYYYMPGVPTVTPEGGNNGPSYKITCTWTKKNGSGSAVNADCTPEYTIYYIPRNYSS